jgi:hypothetical protein
MTTNKEMKAKDFYTGSNTVADDGIHGYFVSRIIEKKSKDEAWKNAISQMQMSFLYSDRLIGGHKNNNPSTGIPQSIATSVCDKIDSYFETVY